MINVGLVGYGYWGPNLARNFSGIGSADLVAICDSDQIALKKAQKSYPGITATRNYQDITSSVAIDAVAIVTPVSTHYEIARHALENGKHVFIEKPFTASVDEAEELIELAQRNNLTIMVDHTFLHTGAVKKIKQLIDDDVLGELYYFDSIRINLGLFQKDINVVWDLAPHDLAIMDFLIQHKPIAVTATGTAHFNHELEDVAYITIYFSGNLIAHINVNWLSPVKIRTTLIGGKKKMLVWNDLVSDEKLRIYDKGVDADEKDKGYNLRMSYRSGDMWSPRIDQVEALRSETEYFVDCVMNGTTPVNDGLSGLRVVRLLEATIKSLKMGGAVVYL
jgi:predicted dehydrogenase